MLPSQVSEKLNRNQPPLKSMNSAPDALKLVYKGLVLRRKDLSNEPTHPSCTVVCITIAYSQASITMDANTSTTLAPSASTLAGPVSSTATTPTDSSKTKSPVPHRPNKAELQSRLFHAHVRAQVRRLRQSMLDQDLPLYSKPQRAHRPSAAAIPRNLPIIITSSGFAILAPTAVRPAHPSTPDAPKLGPLPTPPATPEPETRPLLPTRRSRAAPLERITGSLALNEFGDDPILTPNHVFPDNLRRTPGAAVAKAGKTGSEVDYFCLPPGLFETPVVGQSTSGSTSISASTSTSTPPPTTPVGLGITVPTDDGWRSPSRPRAVVGLGITGFDFEEDGRIERSIPTVM
ncbi:hypothetical protein GSI_02336 [Ganoderma sinense ZZ0214-1]|uniref:Uncharacterized protein n=1 Tax=Ganoderma sinense ZZ0214-1 TaxID=1077348 RepID=A0A2G8SPV5_9APHY|nr:hypothetical protein GSI_02336 [Ganoderma sinense ZZ0214-1]